MPSAQKGVGSGVGDADGATVGCGLGSVEIVGAKVGSVDGARVGARVGHAWHRVGGRGRG